MACLLQLAPKLHRIWQCTTDQKTIANPVGARSDAELLPVPLAQQSAPSFVQQPADTKFGTCANVDFSQRQPTSSSTKNLIKGKRPLEPGSPEGIRKDQETRWQQKTRKERKHRNLR